MADYEPNPKDVMRLRSETGLPMMECKKALNETKGDFEGAKEWLRKNLKGKMDARTDRAAGEGRVAIAVAPDGKCAAIIEVRSETDFTAKNESFGAMAKAVAEEVLKAATGDVAANEGVTKLVDAVRISTSENVSYARGKKFCGPAGTVFGTYVHHDGKQAALVQAEGAAPQDVLKLICQHIVANPIAPQGLTPTDIPADVAEKEKKFAIEQAMESGKPREIAEKMVEGKMRKFFEEVALLKQPLVMDPTKTVEQTLPAGTKLVAFARWKVGGA